MSCVLVGECLKKRIGHPGLHMAVVLGGLMGYIYRVGGKPNKHGLDFSCVV